MKFNIFMLKLKKNTPKTAVTAIFSRGLNFLENMKRGTKISVRIPQ